jgi:hypothetical protein
MYVSKYITNYLLILLTIALSGCGGETQITENSTQISKIQQKGQITDTSTGQAIENVKVSIGENTTKTDKNGYYTLSNLTEKESVVVNFEKKGYLFASTSLKLKYLSETNTTPSNYLEYSMYPNSQQWSQDTTQEIINKNFILSATTYTDADGNTFNGNATINLTVLNNTNNEFLNIFPGNFTGINTNDDLVSFISYGLINLSLKDNKNNNLTLPEGETATLIFNTNIAFENKNNLSLWYYDKKKSIWIEDGYAIQQADGTYKGEITQFGMWSLNKPIEEDPGIYRAHIIDENGLPISHVRIYAKGINWVKSDLSTDENGFFEIKVIPNSSFHLSAYNYKDKYGASYSSTISPIASGNIVED